NTWPRFVERQLIGLEVHAHLACKLDQHERARARLYLNSAMAAAVALPDDPASSDRRRGKAADVTSICTDCSCVRRDHTGARSGTDQRRSDQRGGASCGVRDAKFVAVYMPSSVR